jgi:hypothetical protein
MATPACSRKTTQPVKDHPEAWLETSQGNFPSTLGYINGFQAPVPKIQSSRILTHPLQTSVGINRSQRHDRANAPIHSVGPTFVQQRNTNGFLALQTTLDNTVPSLQAPTKSSDYPLRPPNLSSDGSEILARLIKARARLNYTLYPPPVEPTTRRLPNGYVDIAQRLPHSQQALGPSEPSLPDGPVSGRFT